MSTPDYQVARIGLLLLSFADTGVDFMPIHPIVVIEIFQFGKKWLTDRHCQHSIDDSIIQISGFLEIPCFPKILL